MAILRADLIGKGFITHQTQTGGVLGSSIHGIYEGIVETEDDLSLARNADFDPGSVMLCLANHCIYIKNSSGEWEAAL